MTNPLERETTIGGATVQRTTSLPEVVTPETPRALIMGGLMSEQVHYNGLREELTKLGWIATTFDPPSKQSFAKRFNPTHRDVLRVRGQVPWGVIKDVDMMLAMQDLHPVRGMDQPKTILVPHSLAAYNAAQLAADEKRAKKVEQLILVAPACLGKHSLLNMVVPAKEFFATNALPAARRRVDRDLHAPHPGEAIAKDILYSIGYAGRLAIFADRRVREVYAAATRRVGPHLHGTKNRGVTISALVFSNDPFSTERENAAMADEVGYDHRVVAGTHLSPQEEPEMVAAEIYDLWSKRPVQRHIPETIAA